MSDKSDRVREIFAQAVGRPGAGRRTYVSDACAGDTALLAEVSALLEALDNATHARFLDAPTNGGARGPAGPGGAGTAMQPTLGEEPGAMIGRYKLLQLIGEGGFGTVYMAEQEHPVRRKVALKIIKLGMDTKQVIGRFEVERQALAMMEHPNIAKVLDAGATETGRPYFIMELVKGIPITQYCDQNNLGMRERLELFIPVCNAVQHAHQKGVIHRDIKPNNVMVTLHDGKPVPKVIDFGIAKATDQRLTEKTVFTEFRQFIGTPEYMSPEQAEMSGLDIDTRSDIYALGVLLYELLTGTTPFDARTLRSAAFGEIQRIIRELEPPKPSTRLNTMGQALTAVAKHRQADPGQLSRSVRGDLDWIVMRCLEKDRTRRYETANLLASDIERHLRSEPVLASPPSFSYRVRKFVHRNRAAVLSTALISLALVCGIIGTSWGMWQASGRRDEALLAKDEAVGAKRQADHQRDEAQRAQSAEQAARELAESEAARSKAVTDFLVSTLSLADPQVALVPDMTVRSMLDRAADDVARSLAGQPEAEATVRTAIGRAYVSLGEPELAAPHLRRALQILEGQESAAPTEVYATLWALSAVLWELASFEMNTIGPRAMEAGFDIVAETQPQLSRALRDLYTKVTSGDPSAAARQFEETSRLALASLRPGDPLWLVVANNYFVSGLGLWFYLDNPAAEPLFREALRVNRQELPESHPQISDSIEVLVSILNSTGRSAEAEELVRESIAMRRRVLPEGHWYIAASEISLATCLVNLDRYPEAEALLQNSRVALAEGAGRQMSLILCLGAMVDLYERWGKPDQVARFCAELAAKLAIANAMPGWPVIRAAFGPESSALAEALQDLISISQGSSDPSFRPQTRDERMGAALERILPLLAALPVGDHVAAIASRHLATYSVAWGSWADPVLLHRMASAARAVLQHWENELPTELAFSLLALSELAIAGGDLPAAEGAAREALGLIRQAHAEESWLAALAKKELGISVSRQGRYAEAEPLLVESYAALVGEYPPSHIALGIVELELLREITQLYASWGKPASARPYAERTIALYRSRTEEPGASAQAFNACAWLMLTCEPEDLRDAVSALPLARQAVEMSRGQNAAILDTLALALFMTGDAAQALDIQRKAVALLAPGDSAGRRELEERLAQYEAATGQPVKRDDGRL